MTMKTTLAFFALSAGMAAAQTFPDELVERGRYVATASDCVACHTGSGDKPFAGNHRIASPVGDIWATNITPSITHGIGNYTEQQFADAVRRGIRADGANLYPAMPYTAFAKITDGDMHALYAYFMQGVEPIDEPSQQTVLEFPFNLRFSMKGWNLMFAAGAAHQDDPAQSAEWNRGAYLAEGPGHCSTCHTPRGMLMQEDGGQYLAGAQVGPWYAPNITSDKGAGIGSWQKDEIVAYLATGRAEGKSQAGGSMAEAVSHSFSKMTKDDLGAIATYIMDVPAIAGAARFDQGTAGNRTAEFRGMANPDLTDLGKGAQIYSANCAACHGFNGQGTKDQYYPSLFNNSDTAGAGVNNFIAAVLNGVDRKTDDGHVFMPPFGTQPNAFNSLDDVQIAALTTYAAAQFGDGETKVSAVDVATIRAGGPTSNMVQTVQILIAVAAGGAIALLIIAAILPRSRRQRPEIGKQRR